MLFHNLTYCIHSCFDLCCSFKFCRYPAYSVTSAMLLKDVDDALRYSFFLFSSSLLWYFPVVISTAADPEYAAQHLYRILMCMRCNKAVQLLQVCRLKMAKAFFKISLSCSSSRMRLCKVSRLSSGEPPAGMVGLSPSLLAGGGAIGNSF